MSAIGFAPPLVDLRSRRRLLSSCAVASALVAVGHAGPARAQTVQGYNGSVTSSQNFSGTVGTNQATINLTSNTSVLNWTPTDNAISATDATINFQNATATTTFIGPNANPYTVLNRIVPADTGRSITFNGRTNSFLADGTTKGGAIWFYSPGGIIASGTARFDVGSLLLSTNEIATIGATGYGDPVLNPNQISYSGTAGSTSRIEIQSGAQLLAGGAGANYVALVAPRILQSGRVSATQTAYVAAEQGDMATDVSVNAGLFSFAVTRGTTAPDAITQDATGVTALTAGTAGAHRAFMVAVPKNTAITMLVGGTVSYAGTASVSDGVVVLSTGNISDGLTPQTLNANPGAVVGGTADIVIGNGGTFTSINAASRTNVRTQGGLTVNGNVSLFGNTEVAFGGDGANVSVNRVGGVGGNVLLTSYAQAADGSRTGGRASLFALNNALVTVAGSVTADSSGTAQSLLVPSFAAAALVPGAPSGTGGTASITVTDAVMRVDNAASLLADGTGIAGGTGTGGTAAVDVLRGRLEVGFGQTGTGTGSLLVSAAGIGGSGSTGGDGIGTIARITANGARNDGNLLSVRVAGTTTVSASGTGGASFGNGPSGSGTGGAASIALASALGGTVTRQAQLTSGGAISIGAAGAGGSARFSDGASGGAGIGGVAALSLNDATLGGTAVMLDASGTGAAGASTFGDTAPGAGGTGSGGIASLTSPGSGGTLTVTGLTLSSAGIGGAGGSANASDEAGYGANPGGAGGAGTGGRAVLDGLATVNVTGALLIDASATGGAGGNSATRSGGAGGVANGGVQSATIGTGPLAGAGGAYVIARGGALAVTAQSFDISANGTGGAGGLATGAQGLNGNGGGGGGGSARVGPAVVGGTGASLVATSLGVASYVRATGLGGRAGGTFAPRGGTGGVGLGGGHNTTFGGASIDGSGVLIAGLLQVDASGQGGGGDAAAGNAIGGKASFAVSGGGTVGSGSALSVSADATGGSSTVGTSSAAATTAGDATAGTATVVVDNATVGFDGDLAISASATGGTGPFNRNVIGGDATGGTASLTVRNSSATVGGSVTVEAEGLAGDADSASGGIGIGGAATILVDGATLMAQSLDLDAEGYGGYTFTDSADDIFTGGVGTGGTASLTVTSGSVTVSEETTISAEGYGGSAGESGYGGSPGSRSLGGIGTGGGFGTAPGGATLELGLGSATLGDLTVSAAGIGGSSTAGGAAGGGRGGRAAVSIGPNFGSGDGLTATGILVSAAGTGGENASGYGSGGGSGGIGTGGSASLDALGQAVTVTGGLIRLDASGIGGDGADEDQSAGRISGSGAAGTGGSATLTITDALVTSAGIGVFADGFGGNGGSGFDTNGVGGTGTGGGAAGATGTTGAAITVSGANGAIETTGNLVVSADGIGGAGGSGGEGSELGAAGGAGVGGAVSVALSDGAAVRVGEIEDDGDDEDDGGEDGEIIGVEAVEPGRSSDTIVLALSAVGIGGNGGGGDYSGSTATPLGGAGGDATGGTVELTASNGVNVSVGNILLDAHAIGGDGADQVRGGNATGGRANISAGGSAIEATDPPVEDLAASVAIDVHANAGLGGGSAVGGDASLSVFDGGSFDDDMLIDVSATATDGVDGHFGIDGADGGEAIAGGISLDQAGGDIDGLSILAFARAGSGGNAVEAGYGASGGAGGDASGGLVRLSAADGGSITLTSLDLSRSAGDGGNGSSGSAGAAGTNGTDGVRTLDANGNFVSDTPATAGTDGTDAVAGGNAGIGGNAIGADFAITSFSGGRITRSAAEGDNGIDVSVIGGNGGNGGAGADGGAGGTGGQGTATTTNTDGTVVPGSPAGANGRQGLAGGGGAGGDGGVASAGSALIDAQGGLIELGDLFIDASATGGDGGTGGTGGGGRDGLIVGGLGFPGGGFGGTVTLQTSDGIDGDGGTAFGRITGGALRIDATANGGFSEQGGFFLQGTSGVVSFDAAGNFVPVDPVEEGVVTPRSIALGSLDITAFGAARFGVFDPPVADFASVDLRARDGGGISVDGGVSIQTDYHASLRVENGGTIAVGDGIDIFAGSYVTAFQFAEGESPANLILADRVNIFSDGDVILDAPIVATRDRETAGTIDAVARGTLSANGLIATDSIVLRGGQGVTAGNLATTALADTAATSLDDAGGGTIDIIAGENFDSDLLPDVTLADANIDVVGTVQASNAVRLTAGGDISILTGKDGAPNAALLSDNLVRIDAGDNVRVESGTVVRAGLNPIADPADTGDRDLETGAGLVITAGRQPRNYTPDANLDDDPGNDDIASIVIDGTLSSGVLGDGGLVGGSAQRRPIFIAGQAVQADAGSIAGRSLVIDIDDAPAPGAPQSDDGGLRDGCVQGDVCLGALDITNLLVIGGFDGEEELPTELRLNGGTSTVGTSLRAQGNVTLGTDGASETFAGSDLLRVQSVGGSVTLLGGTTLSGGTAPATFGGLVQVLGETGIFGGGATIQGDGVVGLYTGSGGLELGSLIAGTLNSLDPVADEGSGDDLPQYPVTNSDGLTINGPVTINDRLAVTNGSVAIAATGDVFVNRAEVGDGNAIAIASSGGDVVVNDATAGELGTASTIDIMSDTGSATLGAGDAQGAITVSGAQSASAGSGGGAVSGLDIEVRSDTGAATLANGNAQRDILIFAGTLAEAGAITAGDDIVINGNTVRIGNATTTGAFNESGYGGDGSNLAAQAAGALDVTGTANAFDGLRLTSSGGRITANTLSAGDDAIVTGATLAITSVTSRGTTIESGYGAAAPAGSNIVLTATSAGALTLPSILVTDANAFQDLTLSATNAAGTIAATNLRAGRDIGATAGGAVTVTGANAGRDLALTSSNATLNAGTLVAGRNIALAALGDVTLANATANGPAVASTNPASAAPTSGLVTISAGRTGATGPFAAADATITGTVIARGHIQANAGRDVVVGSTARLLSDNRITLNAGDDVLIRNGAEARAGLAPLPGSVLPPVNGVSSVIVPAGLFLVAGTAQLNYTPPSGNVAAVIVDGTISSANSPIVITAGAVQADSSTLVAGGLLVNVPNSPAAGAPQSNDGGQLRPGCLQGDVCLGNVTLTGFSAGTMTFPGALRIGTATTAVPTNVRIAGTVDVASMEVTAKNGITLGNAAVATRIAQTSAGAVSLTANAGAVNLLGNLLLTGGSVAPANAPINIVAATDVNAAAATIVARSALNITAGGSVTLDRAESGTRIGIDAGADITAGVLSNIAPAVADPEQSDSGIILSAGRDVTVLGADAIGDFEVEAGRDVVVGNAVTRAAAPGVDETGSDIEIEAGGSVNLTSASASDDAFISAGTSLTIGRLTANGQDDPAGEDSLGGNIELEARTINAASLIAITDITAEAQSLLRVDEAIANGTIDLSALGTDQPASSGAPDGVLAAELGTILAGTQLIIDTPNGGIRFARLEAPDIDLTAATRIAGGDATARTGSVNATAPGDIALGTVNAADDIFITAGGSVTATSLSSAIGATTPDYRAIEIVAGGAIDVGAARADRGDVDFAATGPVNLGTGSAGDSILLVSDEADVTAGTLVAGTFPQGADTDDEYRGAIGIAGQTGVTVTSATALADIGIVAFDGDIVTGGLDTDANIVLLAANNVTTGTVRAGQRFYVANASMLDTLGEEIDPTLLDGATPVSTGGFVSLDGDVDAGSVTVAAGTSIDAGTVTAREAIRLTSSFNDIDADTLVAGTDVDVRAGTMLGDDALGLGGITIDTVRAGGDINLAAASSVRVATDIAAGGDITATGTDIALNAFGDLRIATVDATAGSVALTSSGGAISVDRATATAAVLLASGDGLGGLADPARSVTAGTIEAGTAVTVTALGPIDIGTVTASSAVVLTSAGTVDVDGVTARSINARSTGSSLRIGTLDIERDVMLASVASLALGDGTSPIEVSGLISARSSAGMLTTGALTAGGGIQLAGATGLTAGNLRAQLGIAATSGSGTFAAQDVESVGGGVRLTAGGDMQVGDVRAAGSIFLTGSAAITAGDLTAGTGPLLPGAGGGGGVGGIDAAPAGIASGFDALAFERCLDCAREADLPDGFAVNFFGEIYDTTNISDHGYITFIEPQDIFTPGGLGENYNGLPIIAAFFADVDIRPQDAGTITYGSNTFAGRQAFGVTWNNVGYYNQKVDKRNTFQLILTNRADTGAGNFDIYFNYADINWETGDLSNGVNGLGGISAAVGFNAGTGNQPGTFFELPGSLTPGSFLNGGPAQLITTSNNGNVGQLLFNVRSGMVDAGGPAGPPTVSVTNIAAGNTAAITLGNISAEATEVHGAGNVTVGDVSIADRGSGIDVTGNRFATVLDATGNLLAGNIASTGLVALGASDGDVATGAITTGSSAIVLTGGSVALGAVTTGRGGADSLFISDASALAGTPALAAFSLDTLLGATPFDTAALAGAAPVRIGGTLTLAAPVSTGNLLAAASGAVDIAAVDAANRIFVDGGADVTTGSLLAVDSLTVRALRNLFVRDAVASASNGNVMLASGFPASGTGAYLLDGNTTVSGTVSGGGTVRIEGGGDVSIADTGRIRSDGAITIASGDDILVGSGATIGLGHVAVVPAGTQAQAQLGGPADRVTLAAGLLRAGTANPAENGASAIVMNGTTDGLAVAFNSEAIDIGTSGRVGTAATQTLAFANTGTGGTIIGGTATGEDSGYVLSADELTRTRGAAIGVAAPGDATVRTLALTGSDATGGNLVGPAASFTIASPGAVSVEGAATISSAAQTDLFAITAGNRITVLTPGGSIALTGTGTTPAGRIALAAPRIVVATQAAITALDGLTTLDARDERLGANDGALSDAGFLQANALEFRVGNALYIQNSGTGLGSELRRGFTAGAGGVAIVTTGTSPAEIVINGRMVSSDGGFVTGVDLIPRLTLSGSAPATMASFDPRSTANGCLIVGVSCRFDVVMPPPPDPTPPPPDPTPPPPDPTPPPPDPTPPPPDPTPPPPDPTPPPPDPTPPPPLPVVPTPPSQPVQDVIGQIVNGQDELTGAISSVVQQLNSPLIELIDFTPFRLAGIIDEPVTGAGNDDFYTSFAGDDAMSTNVTIGEQVTGTGNDLTTPAESDGKCDPAQRNTDPDCK